MHNNRGGVMNELNEVNRNNLLFIDLLILFLVYAVLHILYFDYLILHFFIKNFEIFATLKQKIIIVIILKEN